MPVDGVLKGGSMFYTCEKSPARGNVNGACVPKLYDQRHDLIITMIQFLVNSSYIRNNHATHSDSE